MKIWVGIIHNNEQQPIKKIPEREVKAATRHGTYRIAPNFRGTKIFADRPLTNFRGNKFRGSRIPVSHAQHYLLTVAATPCSAARFVLLVEIRLGPF